MPALNNLIGQKFNNLLVIKRVHNAKNGKAQWLCLCNCGKEAVINGTALINNHTKSCGCLKSQILAALQTSHGLSKTRLYNIWGKIIQRCQNKKTINYLNYGGRGITVCDEWKEFIPFRDWAMANGYQEGLTIDRINNAGDYTPGNCRWVTYKEQAGNTRKNIIVNGVCLAEYCRKHNLPYNTIRARIISYKWPIKKALSTDIRPHK